MAQPPRGGEETQLDTLLAPARTLDSITPFDPTLDGAPLTNDGQRYQLGAIIGRGGMGEVRLARDTWIGRDVAVKVLRGERSPAELVARFRREARVQGRLEHPAIVPVHDIGTDADGRAFFVMKRLTGATLAEIIAERGTRWSRRTLLTRLVDVCQAIAFAHTRGVIHRDLKPGNIMLGDFGEVYVLDWGIARIIGEEPTTSAAHPDVAIDDVTKTQTGSVLGTLGYMPPEQVRGEAVDPSADVYALGCILFEILTGASALPIGDRAFEATLDAIAHRPRERAPAAEVPPELDELCAAATAPVRDDRLATAKAFAAGLQRYLDGDRDDAQRRELAISHVTAAKALLAQASVATRGDAMLEAGRALALDRTNRDAQALIAQLLLERPAEVPPEVDAAIEAARVEAGSVQLRTAVKTNLAYFLAAPLLLLTEVRAPSVLLVIAGLLLATAALFTFGARRAKPVGRLMYLGLFLQCSLLVAIAVLFSPFLLLPGLAAISVTAFATHPTSNVPFAIIAMHVLALVTPIAAELLGILPHTFSTSGATLSISPWALVIPAVHLVWVVTLFAIAQMLTAVMLVLQIRRAQESAQRDVYSYRWHLEQLVR